MRIVLYDDYKVGLLKNENVVDVSGVVPLGGTPAVTIEGVIANFQSLKGGLQRALDQGEGVPLASVQLRAPVPWPGKIVCMGGNFGEFVGRKGTMWGFLKSPEAVLDLEARGVATRGRQYLPSRGRTGGGHRSPASRSARTVPSGTSLATCAAATSRAAFHPSRASSSASLFKTFAPIGPCIATWDEVPDPDQSQVRMSVDGQPRHDDL